VLARESVMLNSRIEPSARGALYAYRGRFPDSERLSDCKHYIPSFNSEESRSSSVGNPVASILITATSVSGSLRITFALNCP
jgi:hypothetical protein